MDGCGCVAEVPLTRLETKVKGRAKTSISPSPSNPYYHNYQFYRVSALGKSFRWFWSRGMDDGASGDSVTNEKKQKKRIVSKDMNFESLRSSK